METESAPVAELKAEGKTEMTSKDYYFDRSAYFNCNFKIRTNFNEIYRDEK